MNLFTFLLFFFDLTSFETSAILKMLLSAVCGGSIGLGREIHRHSAGLKTFSIVCLGSTLIMIIFFAILPRAVVTYHAWLHRL